MTESIGQLLRRGREDRGLTIEQAAQATHVRPHYLIALEADQFARIPSNTQVRGFIRNYAAYLDLDGPALINILDGQTSIETSIASEAQQETPPKKEIDNATVIYQEIGQKLVRQRQLLGLTLDDISQHTRLRGFYLQALETGDFANLPSPVQARGMLNNYARFLDLDAEALLLRFAEALQMQLAARQTSHPKPKQNPQPKSLQTLWVKRLFSSETALITASVSALVIFLVWAAIRVFALVSAKNPEPTTMPISNALLTTPSEIPTQTPVPPTPTLPSVSINITTDQADISQPAATQSVSDNLVRVYVTIRQRAWMRVLVDGKVEFEGRVLRGSAYQFAGDESVEILTGNGAAIQIFFNQQDLGLLGEFGEVVQRIYTSEGVLTPTPTSTPTPTETPRLAVPTATLSLP